MENRDDADSPLLLSEAKYHENCAGCKQELRKRASQGLPYADLLFVWLVTLSAALPISFLFPFLYFMVKDFHVAKREEDIGFYAGYVGSSFMFGRALTSLLWGMVADRIGRKPVVIMGTISVFLLGSLNGLLGPMRAYATEVCREEYQELSLSVVSTSWGIGLIIGPAIGGFLAQPAEKYPNLFSSNSLFGRFPYFLPCLCISAFSFVVTIACIWLPETLHTNHGDFNDCDNLADTSSANEFIGEDKKTEANKSLVKNWPLMSSIIVYCVFQLHDVAYSEIFSLWAVSDKKYGGLSFTSSDVGQVLSISGFGLLVFQLWFYPRIEKFLGTVTTSRLTAVLSIPLLSSYSYISKLSGFLLKFSITFASATKNILSLFTTTGLLILQNRAVPQSQRGTANGISMTAMSLFKAAGPASGGILFSWAQKRQHSFFFPGDKMVFFVLNIVEFVGIVLTLKPFLTLPAK